MSLHVKLSGSLTVDFVPFGQMFAPCLMQQGVADDTRNSMTCFVVCFQAVKKRKDLKLIVTSATLDAVKFSQYFFESVSDLEIFKNYEIILI